MSAAEKTTRKANLFADMYKYSKGLDYEKALKSSNRLLHEFPDDVMAFQCKIVCCTLLSRFQDVLDFISKNPKLSGTLAYEKAYCQYRLNNTEDAMETLSSMKENSVRKKELMSQILYRLERFETCYDQYREVIKNSSDVYEEERQTNLNAITASLHIVGTDRNLPPVVYETFEQKYNYACQLAAQGKLVEAEAYLTDSEKSSIEYLKEDGLGEEEIEDEVSIIRIQKAYVAQKLGRDKEALRLYTAELKKKPSDAGAVAVASNNVLSINRDQNIFESKKRIKTMNLDGLNYKVTAQQKKTMLTNQCLYYLLTNQHSLCEETFTKILKDYPKNCDDGICLMVSHAARTNRAEVFKVMEKVVKNDRPDLELKIKLGLVQQFLQEGKRVDAEQLLESVALQDYHPGVIGSLVTLYRTDGNMTKAFDLLKKAVNFYKKSGKDKTTMTMLWRQSASLMMGQGEYAEAVKSLEELLAVSPDDVATLAQLVVAYSNCDAEKARKLSTRLPKLPPGGDLDLDAIESPNWLASLKNIKKGGKFEPDQATPKDSGGDGKNAPFLKPKKKKKKSKPGKNFDPDRKPDPERWLPRYERSGFKVKKARSKARGLDVGKGTQGTSSEAAAVYDMTARVVASDSVIAQASPPLKQKSGGKKKGKSR